MKLVTIKNKYIYKPAGYKSADDQPKADEKKSAQKDTAEKAKSGQDETQGPKQAEKQKRSERYKPNQAHIYAVYKDKATGETRLIQMTHVIEPKKEKAIKKGYLMPVKLPNVDMPSGVNNSYYNKDINGDPIDLQKIKAKDIEGKKKKATYIRKSLAEKIIAFAQKKHK